MLSPGAYSGLFQISAAVIYVYSCHLHGDVTGSLYHPAPWPSQSSPLTLLVLVLVLRITWLTLLAAHLAEFFWSKSLYLQQIPRDFLQIGDQMVSDS